MKDSSCKEIVTDFRVSISRVSSNQPSRQAKPIKMMVGLWISGVLKTLNIGMVHNTT